MAPNEATRHQEDGATEAHELAAVLAARGFGLNATLTGMLNEHFSHRTERRGCGFTQASRHLAVLVNEARDDQDTLGRLFPAWALPLPEAAGDSATRSHAEDSLRRVLGEVTAQLEREESRLLSGLITDLALRETRGVSVPELPPFPGELKVGTCPLAEKYFLEISEGFVRRKGRINVIVSDSRRPLLIEKLNLGDNHSCISVAEVVLNGVRLPPGCLLGVKRDEGIEGMANAKLPGSVIPARDCTGFRFLRLTTLAVSPPNRRRAFTTHFQSQLDAGLFAPGEATIEQLRRVAEEQL